MDKRNAQATQRLTPHDANTPLHSFVSSTTNRDLSQRPTFSTDSWLSTGKNDQHSHRRRPHLSAPSATPSPTKSLPRDLRDARTT